MCRLAELWRLASSSTGGKLSVPDESLPLSKGAHLFPQQWSGRYLAMAAAGRGFVCVRSSEEGGRGVARVRPWLGQASAPLLHSGIHGRY